MDTKNPNAVLFRSYGEIRAGDVVRYQIEYTPLPDMEHTSIYVYVYNMEVTPLRAAYLNGPFTLYVDMRPERYDDLRQVRTPADQPHYDNNLKAGQHFKCELMLKGAFKHVWYVDIAGEQLFNRHAVVRHQLVVATSKAAAKSNSDVNSDPRCQAFKVNVKDTKALWVDPVDRPEQEPLHLVILTHGLMSNVTADMLYLKEEIDKQALRAGENVICKGYTGNICRTEKGVKYLGRRVAEWIMKDMVPRYKPAKMSFIGHSLGGLVQTFALGYIHTQDPQFFDNIELVNFVCLASPLLGISTENPGYVRMVLDFGFVGKTGRDLGLSWQIGTRKPLLKTLPTGPSHILLQRFQYRTIYANAVNDGIVPLRTGSLLYLDWRAISKAVAAQRGTNAAHYDEQNDNGDDTEVRSLDGNLEDKVPKGKREHEKHFTGASTGSTHTFNTLTHTVDQVCNWLNPWAPHKVSRRKIAHLQTKVSDGEESPESDDGDTEVHVPKKTSIFESGMALMIAPLPNHEFIGDPRKRADVIFHDRLYFPDDLPPKRTRSAKSMLRPNSTQNQTKEIARNEERMAREWHRDKTWRKVLVQLLPEAHNNIVVRRRFTNAYGWPVIHHVVKTHFPEVGTDIPGVVEGQPHEGENILAQELQDMDLTPTPSSSQYRAKTGVTIEHPDEIDVARLNDLQAKEKDAQKAVDEGGGDVASTNSDVDHTWFDPSISDSEQSTVNDPTM